MFDFIQFSQAIKANLKYKDTCRSIAKEIGISLSTAHRAMNGKEIKINNVIRVCVWLNRPITDFIK